MSFRLLTFAFPSPKQVKISEARIRYRNFLHILHANLFQRVEHFDYEKE